MNDVTDDSKTRAVPIRLSSEYFADTIYDVADGSFLDWESADSSLTREISEHMKGLMREMMRMHKTLCDKYFSWNFSEQTGIASAGEESAYWRLADEIARGLRQELDPRKYEIVEICAPNPNPFDKR